MIIGTTSMKGILNEMELIDCFNVCLNVPTLKTSNEIAAVLSSFNGSIESSQKIGVTIQKRLQDEGNVSGLPIKHFMIAVELAL
jgi:hypothetical protein